MKEANFAEFVRNKTGLKSFSLCPELAAYEPQSKGPKKIETPK